LYIHEGPELTARDEKFNKKSGQRILARFDSAKVKRRKSEPTQKEQEIITQ
jgi:hypothetical protein